MRVKANSTAGRFDVTDDGAGVEGRAGVSLPAQVANHTGLTRALSSALSGVRSWREHDPGVVVRDLAVMLVDGGDCLSDLAPRDPDLFGEHAGQATASQPTAWRTIEAVAADELALTRLERAVARVREHVWSLPGGAPPVLDDESEPVCVDLDATLVTAHSEKDGAAGTYKGTFGYHPDLAFLDRGDGTGEALAGVLRPGNAGSNTAADHVELLDAALAGLPADCDDREVVVRGDVGYATKAFLAHVVAQGCGFSVSFEITEPIKTAIRGLDERAWQPAIRQDDTLRPGAAVAELTHQITLPEGWPDGARLIVRREPLHPGARANHATTSTAAGSPPCSPTRPNPTSPPSRQLMRARARAEDRIRTLKDLGMGNLPCGEFSRNAVWLNLALLALNLTTWTQALTLDGELARAQPKRLRYQVLHVAARVARSARRVTVRLHADWPWTPQLLTAFQRLRALPPAPV